MILARAFAVLLAWALVAGSASAAAAAPLTPDALYGAWVLDEAAATKEQAAAVASAKAIEGFGIVLTLRTARITFVADEPISGPWRLEAATATTATLVVQPKGGEERRYAITVDKDRLTVAEAPGGVPFKRKR